MGPNIARNAIVNCTELVTYDLIKDALLRSTPLTGNLFIFKGPPDVARFNLCSAVSVCTSGIHFENVVLNCFFSFCRWSPMPLYISLWCRFLHHRDCLTSWCCENKIHELISWPVQRCCKLRLFHATQRGTHGFLQRVGHNMAYERPCLFYLHLHTQVPNVALSTNGTEVPSHGLGMLHEAVTYSGAYCFMFHFPGSCLLSWDWAPGTWWCSWLTSSLNVLWWWPATTGPPHSR